MVRCSGRSWLFCLSANCELNVRWHRRASRGDIGFARRIGCTRIICHPKKIGLRSGSAIIPMDTAITMWCW